MTPCTFSLLDEAFAIARLTPQPTPDWASRSPSFSSISCSPDELSIVCAADVVPEDVQAERGWRCLKLHGPFAFDQTGILASFATPLAEQQIGIFAVSTFDTDYILLKAQHLDRALAALQAAGHRYAAVQS